jgi:putative FmdB family regulatory protein
MPRYDYKCEKCDFEFTETHSMSEKLTDCIECNAKGSLFRVPLAFVTNTNDSAGHSKPGAIVKKHIEEARKEIKQERQNLKNKDYLS